MVPISLTRRMISPFGVLSAVCLVAAGLTVLVLWHPRMIPAVVGVWTLGIVLVPAARAGRYDVLSSWTMGALCLLIGLTLIGGVGFASDMAVHNGAHATRHAIGFPCH